MIHEGDLIQKRERERNVLFNDALNTFYLRLYGVRHMVKDHSDSEMCPRAGVSEPYMDIDTLIWFPRSKIVPPHRLLFPINSKGSFICTIPQTG